MGKITEGFKRVDEILIPELRTGNISLILDSYDDLYSDFDPRGYSERSLSADFLSECKRAARDKGTRLELRLMVPQDQRNLKDEMKIRKRLKTHFCKHAEENHNEIVKIKKEGALWFFAGVCLMMASVFFYGKQEFFLKLIEVMIVPAAWFMFWEGLGKIFISTKEKQPDYQFYKKMADSQIYFLSY